MNEIGTPSEQPTPPPKTLRPTIPFTPFAADNLWTELAIAFNYLTRFNLPLREAPRPRLIRKSMAWFPIVGALIGFFGASVDWVITQVNMPAIITATFAVLAMLWLTRALHEEECASLVNEYTTPKDGDTKIGWLKEERSIRYGTLAVVIIIILKIGAIASLADNNLAFQSLIAACAWSRAIMVLTASWLKPIVGDPVADHFVQPPALRVLIAVGLGLLINFAVLHKYPEYAWMILATSAGAGIVTAIIGAHHLRGYNGPLLGTIGQVVELSVLGMILAVQ